ncbi:HEXXH motif-containing putative peptide modification protein [Actinoplanes sp. NPDC089786]|uniref:aKG-HExxH-type peptide beta-hydroxylase n=1 Tax=Actinoplanes sp. NPDC089786 TaxID=3155185 RepID=UPI0034226665
MLASHVLRDLLGDDPRVLGVAEVLSRAQSRSPVRAAETFRRGWLGSWASRCLHSGPERTATADDVSALGNLAAAAALRTGVDASVDVAIRAGRIHLPTMGSATVDQSAGTDGTATLIVRPGRPRLINDGGHEEDLPMGDDPRWMSLREIRLGSGRRSLTLTIDDLDPTRDCFVSRPADRLTPEAVRLWWSRGELAWSLLRNHAPESSELTARWTDTLVPLEPAADDANLSISSRAALGSIALSLPAGPVEFGACLVHERAHSMLNGILLFWRLADPAATATYFAPWRRDPRPILGALHGIYAFTAVGELWQQLLAVPELRGEAAGQLARRRVQLRAAIEAVTRSPELTRAGEALVAHSRRRVERLEAVELPHELGRRAEDELVQAYDAWMLRNSAPRG